MRLNRHGTLDFYFINTSNVKNLFARTLFCKMLSKYYGRFQFNLKSTNKILIYFKSGILFETITFQIGFQQLWIFNSLRKAYSHIIFLTTRISINAQILSDFSIRNMPAPDDCRYHLIRVYDLVIPKPSPIIYANSQDRVLYKKKRFQYFNQ